MLSDFSSFDFCLPFCHNRFVLHGEVIEEPQKERKAIQEIVSLANEINQNDNSKSI